MNKIAIYTTLFRNKDMLPNPVEPTKNADYFVYTDKPSRHAFHNPVKVAKNGSGWLNAIKLSRSIKACPHRLQELTDYSTTIWIDANILQTKDLTPLIKQAEDSDIACFTHGYRKNVKEETDELIRLFHQNHTFEKDPNIGNPKDLENLLKYIQSKGFTSNKLWWTAILIRKNNDKVNEAMEEWNKCLEIYHRDQVSFPYIIEKYDLKIKTLSTISYIECPEFQEYFRYIPHRR